MNSDYLHPLSNTFIRSLDQSISHKTLFQSTYFFEGREVDLSQYDIAILGIKEDRFRPEFEGCGKAADEVRKELYKLVKPRTDIRLLDLGNIEAGNQLSDTYFALQHTLAELMKAKIVTLIIGGSQDLIYPQYASFQGLNPNMQLLLVDSKMEMQIHEEKKKNNYLPNIIAHEPEFLFNISHAAYQGHFVESETYDAFERMNFDMLRLGSLRGNMQEIEPYCRNASMLAMSMQAIKASDAPAQNFPSPNGISAEEACQLARYAGMSNDLLSAGFYDLNPTQDRNHTSSALLAQMLWYFIEGYTNRRNDYPVAESKDYLIYHTTNKNMNRELTFYKSVLSNRWWMEVPYPHERSKHEGKFLVPCSYKDYQTAQNDEIPDRWMKTYQKL
ncbi:MAG: formimidoylglutamase [Bacteroidia bacterium]|nr:formimidoylglutamase [Bacteroidia bacterium]MCF8427384.1 formimidoylglutamase [Bacteroidia bacterium]MCF8447352.1 formimidoylglutamase [Bacteroidia bacterium]